MTTTSDRPPTPLPGATDLALELDLTELRRILDGHPFPTHQDDLLALLVARREPMRLACRVATLSRTRDYRSADEVCDELRRGVEGR